MEEREDKIGNLFQEAFHQFQEAPQQGEWERLAGSLQKRNFFRFNAYQFNIYYVGMLLFCFFTCLGVGSHYLYCQLYPVSVVTENEKRDKSILKEGKEMERPQNSHQDHETRIQKEQATPFQKTEMEDKHGVSKTKEGARDNIPFPAQLNEIEEKAKDSSASSHTASLATPPRTGAEKDSLPKKRILYLTKQDTIFQYDTVNTIKTRKRRKK